MVAIVSSSVLPVKESKLSMLKSNCKSGFQTVNTFLPSGRLKMISAFPQVLGEVMMVVQDPHFKLASSFLFRQTENKYKYMQTCSINRGGARKVAPGSWFGYLLVVKGLMYYSFTDSYQPSNERG